MMVQLLLLTLAMGGGPDWPSYRGPDSSGAVSAPDVFKRGFGLKTSWRKELGSAYSGVSIAEDTVVTMYSDGVHDLMVALSPEDGSERWRFKISDVFKGIDGAHDGPLSTPLISDGLTYGLSPQGRLFALQLTDGKLVWEHNLVETFKAEFPRFGMSCSPIVAGDVLVVTTGGAESPAALTGFDKKTGKKLWATGKARTTYQTPLLAKFMGKEQIVLNAYKVMMGVDPSNGELLWEFKHDGGNHGSQPVVIDSNRIYIEKSHDEALLLRASRVDGAVQFEELWSSRELTRNYNVPVYHQGHLYGFGGRFLTCVDVETGKRVWRSRPPGSGFAILVNDHLAIYNRKGSLHLVEATPSGYVEKSAIEVLPGDHYTQPSFAGNKVYIRNLNGIAAVEIGSASVSLLAKEETPGVLPESRFAARMAELSNAMNKRAAVDAFIREQKQFPILEGERMVHVVYRGKAQDVAILGQMVDDLKPMNRVPGTDLYYYSMELEAGARCYYQFSIDFETKTDPLNPNEGPSFYGDEKHSVLAVNSWRDSDHLSQPKQALSIQELTFESKHTNIERKAHVLLPPSYANSKKRYPVLYVSLGKAAMEKGMMPNTLSNLMAAGQMEEVIAVLYEKHSQIGWRESRPSHSAAFGAMLREELVPLVDKTFRTQAQPEGRALLGHYDMASNVLLAALEGERTFANVVTQTAEVDDDAREYLKGLKKLNDVSVRLEWGHYAPSYDARVDVPTWNRKLVELFKKRGVKVEGQQLPIGHGWGNWRTRHDDILKLLFPLRKS